LRGASLLELPAHAGSVRVDLPNGRAVGRLHSPDKYYTTYL
jgi:hypothetical protein